MPQMVGIAKAARSGDGTVENVGRQKFDSQNALDLHCWFVHDPTRHQED